MTDLPLFRDPAYRMFVRFAEEALRAGRTRFSARTIGERMRWETAMRSGGAEFKINNNTIPSWARRLVAEDGRFAGFFEFRGTTE